MKTKKVMQKATKLVKRIGKELGSSPLGRAAKGKRTRGYW